MIVSIRSSAECALFVTSSIRTHYTIRTQWIFINGHWPCFPFEHSHTHPSLISIRKSREMIWFRSKNCKVNVPSLESKQRQKLTLFSFVVLSRSVCYSADFVINFSFRYFKWHRKCKNMLSSVVNNTHTEEGEEIEFHARFVGIAILLSIIIWLKPLI